MKLSNFFIDPIPVNHISYKAVLKRDEDFNNLFSLPNIPRLCISKKPTLNNEWELNDSLNPDGQGDTTL